MRKENEEKQSQARGLSTGDSLSPSGDDAVRPSSDTNSCMSPDLSAFRDDPSISSDFVKPDAEFVISDLPTRTEPPFDHGTAVKLTGFSSSGHTILHQDPQRDPGFYEELQLIRTLRANGFTVSVAPTILVSGQVGIGQTLLRELNRELGAEIVSMHPNAKYPAEMLYRVRDYPEVSEELQDRSASVEVSRFFLSSGYDGLIRLFDLHHPESQLVFEARLDRTSSNYSRDYWAAVHRMRDALVESFRNSENLGNQLAELPAIQAHQRALFEVDSTVQIGVENLQALRRFLVSDSDSIIVTARSAGELNRDNNLTPTYTQIRIDRQMLDRIAAQGSPYFRLNGVVTGIALSRFTPDEKVETNILDAPVGRDPSTGMHYTVSQENVANGVLRWINIQFPRRSTQHPTARELQIDLSEAVFERNQGLQQVFGTSSFVGLELGGFLREHDPGPVYEADGQRIFSPIYHETLRTQNAEHLEQMVRGASELERLFGNTSGTLIHGIYVNDGTNQNAHFDWTTPNQIEFIDEILRERQPISARYIAFHESAHLYDHHLNYSWDNKFRALYGKLRSEQSPLLEFIEERRALPDSGGGGHTRGGDPSEFFASLMTSTFLHPDWSAWIHNPLVADSSAQDVETFQRDYLRALETVRDITERRIDEERIPQPPEDSGILHQLTLCISAINEILK